MRRLMLVLLGFSLCFGLVPGCSSDSNTSNETTLVETKIQLAEESQVILSLDSINGQNIVLYSGEAQQRLLYGELSAGSHELASSKEVVSLSDGQRITAADISSTGDIAYSTITEDGTTTKCYLVSSPGEQKEIPVEIEAAANTSEATEGSSPINAVAQLEFVDAGFILIQDYFGNLTKIDSSTGSTLAKFETASDSQIVDYVVKGDCLVTIVATSLKGESRYSVTSYSLETGAISNTYAELEKALSALLPAETTSITEVNSPVIVDKGNELYLYSDGAVYLVNENNETSKLTSGEDSLLTNASMAPASLLPDNEGGFYVLYIEYRNPSSPYGLYSYSFEHKQPASGSITVYMLEENREITQAIQLFKENNRGVEVTTRVGLPSNTDLSPEDAIKQLNLDMMSGNAPDVIVLDGLSVQQMQDQNLLVDINDIYNKLQSSDSEYFDNVISAYKNEDGTCYAIPARFTAPSALINEEQFSKIETLNDFAELVTSYQGEKESLLGMSIDLATLYAADYKNIVQDDGLVSEEELTSFFEQCLAMVKISQEYLEEHKNPEDGDWDVVGEALAGFSDEQASKMGVSWLLGTPDVLGEIGRIVSPADFSGVALTENCSENNLKFGLLNFGEQQVFIPQATLAVASSSKNSDTAKSFIEFILLFDQQVSDQRVGLPVCKDAFTSVIYKNIEIIDGPDMVSFAGGETFTYGPLSDKEIIEFVAMLDAAEVAYDDDKIITGLIASELESYLRNQKTLEEASESAYQKISLYLLE